MLELGDHCYCKNAQTKLSVTLASPFLGFFLLALITVHLAKSAELDVKEFCFTYRKWPGKAALKFRVISESRYVSKF